MCFNLFTFKTSLGMGKNVFTVRKLMNIYEVCSYFTRGFTKKKLQYICCGY